MPLKFSQALKAVIERAMVRYKKATGQQLTLAQIACDSSIEITTLARALRGEGIDDLSYLLPLLVYLGCDESEQRFLFHLAEFTLPQSAVYEQITDEFAATLFVFPGETEPRLERITEEHRAT